MSEALLISASFFIHLIGSMPAWFFKSIVLVKVRALCLATMLRKYWFYQMVVWTPLVLLAVSVFVLESLASSIPFLFPSLSFELSLLQWLVHLFIPFFQEWVAFSPSFSSRVNSGVTEPLIKAFISSIQDLFISYNEKIEYKKSRL